MKAIDYSNCSLPAFCNLTLLELDVDFLHGWKLLPNLLQSAPNLEVLDFIQVSFDVLNILGKVRFFKYLLLNSRSFPSLFFSFPFLNFFFPVVYPFRGF